MKRILVIAFFALPLFAGAKEDALALQATFEAGARAGKVEQMVSIYADDAVLMPPNMPSMTGREGIAQYWGGMIQQLGNVEVDLVIEDFEVSGDLAVERGRYEITAPIKDSGKYVIVLRKREGKWLVVTDIFNASQPAPQPK